MTARELLVLIELVYPEYTDKTQPSYVLKDYIRQECANRYGNAFYQEIIDDLESDAEREEEDNDGHRGVGA
jgi:hypothetical protein